MFDMYRTLWYKMFINSDAIWQSELKDDSLVSEILDGQFGNDVVIYGFRRKEYYDYE